MKTIFYGKVHPATGNSHTDSEDYIHSEEGAWTIPLPPEGGYMHFVSLKFFDGAHGGSKYGQPITPTAGNIEVTVTDNGVTYGPVYQGKFKLTELYQQPNFLGHAESVRVKVTGLAPAHPAGGISTESTYVRVEINSFM